VFNFPFEVEHVVPRSGEGTDSETNWALACRSCNLRKAAHVSGLDPESRVVVRLFHPRNDRWDEHFQVDPTSGAIDGLTAIGRASVAVLTMNSEAQLAARRQWTRLGLFP
jgi:hypothetical protein